MSCISIISRNSDKKIASCGQFARVDTIELKSRLFKRIGRQKTVKYLYNLNKLLNLKLTKLEFDKLCYHTIGKENIPLHNLFIKSIISNAFLSLPPPPVSKQTATGNSITGMCKLHTGQSGDAIPRTSNKDIRPLKADGKAPRGGVGSVEDGEEVEQVRSIPCVQSRGPIRGPLGIPKDIRGGFFRVLDQFDSELPDTRDLLKYLGTKLGTQGIELSLDCADLLNNGLDLFLKRLIRSSMDLARSRDGFANNKFYRASLQDFHVAVEMKPDMLGVDWPRWIEKIDSGFSEK